MAEVGRDHEEVRRVVQVRREDLPVEILERRSEGADQDGDELDVSILEQVRDEGQVELEGVLRLVHLPAHRLEVARRAERRRDRGVDGHRAEGGVVGLAAGGAAGAEVDVVRWPQDEDALDPLQQRAGGTEPGLSSVADKVASAAGAPPGRCGGRRAPPSARCSRTPHAAR